MTMKLAEAKQMGTLSDEAIDAIAPMIEQRHQKLFGQGAPYEGQALPMAPGSLAEMLKKGGSGIRDYIEGQQDAIPQDMPTAVRMEARKPGSGAEFLQKRRSERMDNMAPTIQGHVRTIVQGLQDQMSGGTPTYANVMDAVDKELKSQPDDVLAKEFNGEKRDFIAKAVQRELKSDSPFIKGLNVQVGPGDVTKMGMGDASQFMSQAITQIGLKNVTPETLLQQPGDVQAKVKALANEMASGKKVEIAQQTGVNQIIRQNQNRLDMPLTESYKEDTHWINKSTGMPVDRVLGSLGAIRDAGGEDKFAILKGPDWESYLAIQGMKKDIAAQIPFMKELSTRPGVQTAAQAVQYYLESKMGAAYDNPMLALQAYNADNIRLVKAMSGSSRITNNELAAFQATTIATTDTAQQALKKMTYRNNLLQSMEDVHLGKIGNEQLDSKLRAAYEDIMKTDMTQAMKHAGPGMKFIRNIQTGEVRGPVAKSGKAPAGWEDAQ
jgi:hypothetical protein